MKQSWQTHIAYNLVQEGYQVITVADGTSALNAVHT